LVVGLDAKVVGAVVGTTVVVVGVVVPSVVVGQTQGVVVSTEESVGLVVVVDVVSDSVEVRGHSVVTVSVGQTHSDSSVVVVVTVVVGVSFSEVVVSEVVVSEVVVSLFSWFSRFQATKSFDSEFDCIDEAESDSEDEKPKASNPGIPGRGHLGAADPSVIQK